MSKWARGLFLALLVAGCSKPVSQLLEQARKYQSQGEQTSAVIELKNVLAQDAGHAEAHLLLGTILADIGEALDSEKALLRAMELGISPDRVLPVLGRALLDAEKYQQLLDEIKPASSLSPGTQNEIALIRGRAYLHLGAFGEARTQFSLARQDRPADAMLGMAQIAAFQGDVKSAEKLVEEILATTAETAETWLFKGDLLRQQGKNEEALLSYRRAAKLRPSNAMAHLGQAVIHVSTADYEAARSEIRVATSLAPASAMLHFTRALLALHESRYTECREALQQVWLRIPQHSPSMLLSGSLYFATGQLEQAQNAYTAYLSRWPGNVYARKMLAATLLRKGQPQSAAYTMDPLLVLIPQDPELLALAGQAQLQLGQMQKARQYFEKAVALEPGNPRTRTSLGLTRLALGDSRAASDFESAVAIRPNDAQAENYLVMALIAHNETAKAMEVAQALVKKRPDNPGAHLLTGAVRLARKEFPLARASLERAVKLQPGYFPAAAALAQLDMREGNLKAAHARMETVLKDDKRNLDAMLALAKFEFDAGHGKEAIGWLRQAQAAHPRASQVFLMLAQIQLQLGQPDDSLTAAKQARDMNPHDPRVLEILGKAQLAMGANSAAAVSFTTLNGLNPNYAPAYLLLASAYAADDKYREAVAAAKAALKIAPSWLEANTSLAAIYLKNKQFKEALELAHQMQKQNPHTAYMVEGDASMALQDFARAARAYRKADAIQNSGLLRIRIHEAESVASKGIASDTPLLEWLYRHPDDIDPRLYLADSYTRAGNFKAAIGHYEALVRLRPRDFRILNNFAWALRQADDPRTIDYAQQAFQLKPDDAAIADTLGWALVGQGKLHDGLQMMFKAVSLDPRNAAIRYRLAQALVRAGDPVRARNELRSLLESGDKFAEREQALALSQKLDRQK